MRSRQCRPAVAAASRSIFGALLFAVMIAGSAAPVAAETPPLDELVAAVVGIKTYINPDARTGDTLGREREGSGIVIDDDGLVLTIGYLMVEAHAAQIVTAAGRTVPANIVGYDHESGFGLLKAIAPLKVKPMALGKSAAVQPGDPVVFAGAGGVLAPVHVVAKREFAGGWEYLIDGALFTAPPLPNWSGAALIARDGRLVGVGSLVVGDARARGAAMPGNMFVPIDLLPPILADLIADGRVGGLASPWLGVSTEEAFGNLFVQRVTPGGPAEAAGLVRGTRIVGVAGEPASSLADFYRRVRSLGPAGTTIPLDVMQDGTTKRIDVKSMNRLDHLKLKSTL